MAIRDTLDEARYSVQVRKRVEVPEYGPIPDDCGAWSAWDTLLTCDGDRAREAMEAFQRANRGLPREYRLVHAPTDRERWFGATAGTCLA